MRAILLREIRSHYQGGLGFGFAAFLMLFAGIYTMAYNLALGIAHFEYVVSAVSIVYLIAVPILTMRVLAGERRQKTDQLLYALPISLAAVALGKYLALLLVLMCPVALMGLYPLWLMPFGAVPLGAAYTALTGFFLLGAALLSIGLFISSVSQSQVTCAFLCLAAMLLSYFMTALSGFVSASAPSSLAALIALSTLLALAVYLFTRRIALSAATLCALSGALLAWYFANRSAFEGLFARTLRALSAFDRFEPFAQGIFDLTGVVYFLSVTGVFLFLTVQSLERRRWSA